MLERGVRSDHKICERLMAKGSMPEAIKLTNGRGSYKLLDLFDSSRIKKDKKSVLYHNQ